MSIPTQFKFKKTILAGAIFACMPMLADAADSKDTKKEKSETEQVETLEVVGSMSKTGTVKFYDTKSTDSISEEKLNEKAVQKVDDALAYTSGATTAPYGKDARTPWLKIRGLDTSFTLDGMPQFSTGYFYSVPEIYGIEKIEVLKGASSELYGSSKPGGTVNMITKRPKNNPAGDIQLTYGTSNQMGVGADYSGLIADSVRYRLVGEYRDEDGMQKYTDNGKEKATGLAHYYVAPSLTWDISNKTSLTLLTSYQKDTGVPENVFFPAYGSVTNLASGSRVSRNSFYGDPDFDKFNREITTAGYELRHIFDNGIKFTQNYKFVHQDLDLVVINATGKASDTTYSRWATAESGINNTHTIDNRLSKDFDLGIVKDTLLVGVDYMNTNMQGKNDKYSADNINIINPESTGVAKIGSTPFNLSAYEAGFYAQNSITIKNDIIFNQGIRESIAKNNGYWNGEFDRNFKHTSYNAGLMYIFNNNLSPYVNYSQSFLPVYGYDANARDTYKPLTASQWESGVKYEPEWMNGTFTLAYFNIVAQNSFIPSSNGGNATQANEIRSQGVELQMNGNLTDNIGVELSYTFTDSETDTDTKTVQTGMIPKNSAAAWVNYNFNGRLTGLTAGTGLRYIGETVDKVYNPDLIVPKVLLWDAMVKYQFNKSWSGQLNATNLTDKEYISGCYSSCYWGAERSVVASVSYKW